MTTETNEIAERDYYTPAQLAQILQVHPQTLQKYRTTATGPDFILVGRSVRYPKDWFKDWCDTNRRRITGSVS